MNNNIKEVSRRSMYRCVEGNYGLSLTTVDAEIVVEDEGKTIYLHAQWLDATDEVEYQASTRSIYDFEETNSVDMKEFEKLVDERDRVYEESKVDFKKYRTPFAEELRQMIESERKAHKND